MPREMSRESILRRLEEHGGELRSFGVRKIGLFGSFLHGNPRPGSDLDLLVRLDPPTFDGFMDTKFFLENLFEREVDLVSEPALKPALAHLRDEAVYAALG